MLPTNRHCCGSQAHCVRVLGSEGAVSPLAGSEHGSRLAIAVDTRAFTFLGGAHADTFSSSGSFKDFSDIVSLGALPSHPGPLYWELWGVDSVITQVNLSRDMSVTFTSVSWSLGFAFEDRKAWGNVGPG